MSEVGAPGAGAPAPAPEPSAPLPEGGQARPPAPASSTPAARDGETSVGQPPPRLDRGERRSISDSLDKAFEAAKTETKPEPKTKPEPEKKAAPEPSAKAKPEPAQPPSRERGEGGRFVSSQNEPAASSGQAGGPEGGQQTHPEGGDHHQPPHRYSSEAKADWANTPDTVKAETHRALRELEAGHHKHKEAAEAYEPWRRWDEMARQSGTTGPKAMENYVTIEAAVASDNIQHKLQGIERVLARGGLTPQQYASYITQQPMQPQDQRDAEQRLTINRLEQRLVAAEQREAERDRKDQYKEINGSVKEFARERPRFDELSLTVAGFLNGKNDRGIHIDPQLPADQRLQQAYQLAEELNPSASRSSPLKPEPRPANGAGQKSIAGSPANGSDPSLPAKKGRHPTREESLDRAFAKLS